MSWSTRHLDRQALSLEDKIRGLQKAIRLEESRQQYETAYESFQFVLSRQPGEARIMLDRLLRQYPELLRNDHRLKYDFQRLLAVETSAFEDQLRSRLGL